MEQETDLLHVLTSHPLFIFLVGALVIAGLCILVGFLLGRRRPRRKNDE